MPGLESLLGVWEVKAMQGQPREQEARQLLEKIADQMDLGESRKDDVSRPPTSAPLDQEECIDSPCCPRPRSTDDVPIGFVSTPIQNSSRDFSRDLGHVREKQIIWIRVDDERHSDAAIAPKVKPICVAHKWKVQRLEEFIPPNPNLLGMNVGRQKILIRLRPAGALGSFYPYESLLHTMLHELVHMEIGPHNARFYKMLDELSDECEQLMRQGISGRNMPFAGEGWSLGGGRAPIDARAAALKAAERRKQHQSIMSGGRRLGGSANPGRSAAERAAAAAEWRQALSRGCAITGSGVGSWAGQGDEVGSSSSPAPALRDGDWSCERCTLRNDATVERCIICGAYRPKKLQDDDAGKVRRANGGGRKAAQGVPTVRMSSPRKETDSGVVSSTGGQKRGTWRCKRCPFLFPNPAERSTCESCGAPREQEDTERASSGGTEAWACDVCTALNPTTSLSCMVCLAPRPSLASIGSSSRMGAGRVSEVVCVEESRPGTAIDRTCNMCTFLNNAGAVSCEMCGIPLDAPAAARAGGARSGGFENRRGRAASGVPEIVDLT